MSIALFFEDFYNTKLKRYMNANDWDRNGDLLLNVIYDVVGIRANKETGSLELSTDFVKVKNAIQNEKKIIELFMSYCQKLDCKINTFFFEIGCKFPYKINTEEIKADKVRIIY